MERLNKYLARSGVASRRKADELILEGQVEVNGIAVTELGVKIDPLKDRLKVKGKQVKPPSEEVYYILNKPAGIITAASDVKVKTVLDLVKVRERVFPVGRLDKESRGLVLLTNDGELTYKILHPKFKYPKKYEVLIEGNLDEAAKDQLLSGIYLTEGKARISSLRVLKSMRDKQLLEVILKQGIKRQIRRMLLITGHKVLDLKRMAIGPIELGHLSKGNYRALTPAEVKKLKAFAEGK